MSTYAQQAAKALRLAQEHAGRADVAHNLREGERFFPVDNNGSQTFTARKIEQDPSPVGNTLHKFMVTTEAQPVFVDKFDKVVILPPVPEELEVEIHHWQPGHRHDPMTGLKACLVCGSPEHSPEHW